VTLLHHGQLALRLNQWTAGYRANTCLSLYFAKGKELLELIEIKFIYRAMHACIEFKPGLNSKVLIEKNLFPAFLTT